MDTFTLVKFITAGQLCISPDDITMESKFISELGADSLDIIALSQSCFNETGVKLPDRVVTVGEVVKYIDEHKCKKVNNT